MSQAHTYRAFGVNHRTAPLAVRERYRLDDSAVENFYRETRLEGKPEWMVLSTCNRTEVYLYGTQRDEEEIREFLNGSLGPALREDHTFSFHGNDVLEHVIEMVSGLRSQVMGDTEVLSQVKGAYRLASHAGTLGPWMHRLMHTAFATAKEIASTTAFSGYGGSVARSAVEAAKRAVREGGSCLVLGAGRMGQLVLREATKADLRVTLVNRSGDKARQEASHHGVETADWAARYELASRAHAVIATTSSPGPILEAGRLLPVTPGRSVTLIDIGVPRNVEPTAAAREGYELKDIDALPYQKHERGDGFRLARQAALDLCRRRTEELASWKKQHGAVEPAVQALYQTFETVRGRQLATTMQRFSPEDRPEVDRLTRSIVQKILAIPVVRLKHLAGSGADISSETRLLADLFRQPEYPRDGSEQPEYRREDP